MSGAVTSSVSSVCALWGSSRCVLAAEVSPESLPAPHAVRTNLRQDLTARSPSFLRGCFRRGALGFPASPELSASHAVPRGLSETSAQSRCRAPRRFIASGKWHGRGRCSVCSGGWKLPGSPQNTLGEQTAHAWLPIPPGSAASGQHLPAS